ncbi:hypothetical protein RB595_007027 [Gaeumannomyces hyphopodioides]
MAGKDTTAAPSASPEFEAFYLQRATRELAEDLDRVRAADDFRGPDAVPMLVRALRQGAASFSPRDQARIVAGATATATTDKAAK